ncbi:protein unc-80 homolog [Copidosoma floridanum]|uniref:protein unc-80 homolog n=1 Tax=Copidosoma floridanum TaxID=29053 RepID=UPI000C6F5E48|nr:protein unc-80 homolog [Copidosoma floridanum]
MGGLTILGEGKDFQNLSPQESTLLYILHWIILDSSEECVSQEEVEDDPFYHLFSISTITLFVYLFIPLCNKLKDINFESSLRLENGQKIWYPIYKCCHPQVECFTASCQPKPKSYSRAVDTIRNYQNTSYNGFDSSKASLMSHQIMTASIGQSILPINNVKDENASEAISWVSSPKDKVFPETIPEESSSNEDEHVVIFTLPSHNESQILLDGIKQVSTIFAGDASIFHVAMEQGSCSIIPTLTAERVNTNGDFNTYKMIDASDGFQNTKQPTTKLWNQNSANVDFDVRAASFLDVAVLRCLFFSQWQEEGIYWSLQFLYERDVMRIIVKTYHAKFQGLC